MAPASAHSVTVKNTIVGRYLGQEALAADLARSLPVHYGTLRNWVKQVRRGVRLQETGGRPRLIDAESHTAICLYLHFHPHTDVAALRRLISDEYRASQFRSSNNDPDDPSQVYLILDMEKRTMRNYLKRYLAIMGGG
jgi:transposase